MYIYVNVYCNVILLYYIFINLIYFFILYLNRNILYIIYLYKYNYILFDFLNIIKYCT